MKLKQKRKIIMKSKIKKEQRRFSEEPVFFLKKVKNEYTGKTTLGKVFYVTEEELDKLADDSELREWFKNNRKK